MKKIIFAAVFSLVVLTGCTNYSLFDGFYSDYSDYGDSYEDYDYDEDYVECDREHVDVDVDNTVKDYGFNDYEIEDETYGYSGDFSVELEKVDGIITDVSIDSRGNDDLYDNELDSIEHSIEKDKIMPVYNEKMTITQTMYDSIVKAFNTANK